MQKRDNCKIVLYACSVKWLYWEPLKSIYCVEDRRTGEVGQSSSLKLACEMYVDIK